MSRYVNYDIDVDDVYEESCNCKKGKVDFDTECGDVEFRKESDDTTCHGKKCGKDIDFKTEDGDSDNLDNSVEFNDNDNDVDFDTECGDINFKKEAVGNDSDVAKCEGTCKTTSSCASTKNSYVKRDSDTTSQNDEKVTKESYQVPLLASMEAISESQLQTERQIMTKLMEDLYKEYLMDGFSVSTDYFAEMDNVSSDDDNYAESYNAEDTDYEDYYQERFLGGAGKSTANMAKPVAKVGKKMLDVKHGVGRKGIIRNVVHRTKKDLRKGGVLYQLLTWPFLIVKNLVQTIYHKTKSFVTYKGLLIGIEVKINREISKIRKRMRNIPKMALANGVGFAAATAGSLAKGEGLPLKPSEFIASQGAKLVEELGRDTMLRALTSKLATAIEESPEAIKNAIAKGKDAKSMSKITPSMGEHAKPVITMNKNKITVEGLVNMTGINKMMDDIDKWAEIAEGVVLGVRDGDESCVNSYLSQMKALESTYLKNGKLDMGCIYHKSSGSVKIADFYEELAAKLTEKARQLEKGIEKIADLENAIKSGEISIASDTEKLLAEINVAIQHTCNAFMEMINSLDDLGKYVMNTMETYLDCLKTTAETLENSKGKSSVDENGEIRNRKHKLFVKKDKRDEDDVT